MIALYIFICLITAGFFAGMETGMLGADRALLQEKKRGGIFYAKTAEYLLMKQDRLLGITLIGHNIATVAAAVLFTNFMTRIDLENFTWLGILLITFIFLVFDDIIPKSFYRQHADTITVRLSPLLLILYFLLLPVYVILNTIVQLLLFVFGQQVNRREEMRSKRDIRFLVNLAGKNAGIPDADRRIIEDIFDFREQFAKDIMIPFHQLPVINVHQKLEDAVALSSQTGLRFIPVSETRTDNLIGYIDTRELLRREERTVKGSMQQAVFYPEIIKLPDLLLGMKRRHLEVAFLSDEYGGVSGMITPSKIIGDLFHYTPEEGYQGTMVHTLGPGRYGVSGLMNLEDFCHTMGIQLKKGYNGTVGGYLCERLGEIPEIGRTHEEGGILFTIAKRDDRRIQEIEVHRRS